MKEKEPPVTDIGSSFCDISVDENDFCIIRVNYTELYEIDSFSDQRETANQVDGTRVNKLSTIHNCF